MMTGSQDKTNGSGAGGGGDDDSTNLVGSRYTECYSQNHHVQNKKLDVNQNFCSFLKTVSIND